MQTEFRHFVITRIGLGIYNEDRLNKMADLFGAVTLPSVRGQTKQDFVWLIVIDAACPVGIKGKLSRLVEACQNCHFVPIDLTSVVNVRLANFDWVWEACQTFILERQLIASPEEYVTTSIIDADDAWNRETIATVHRLVAGKMPELFEKIETRGTWLRHSVGVTITFSNGYIWHISARTFWPLKNEFRSMSVFVTARFSSGISACSCRHTQWRKYSEILEFEVMSLTSKEPMWIYSRHDEAVESWDARQGMPMSASFAERLQGMFGVDCDKVDRWLQEYPPTTEIEKQFNPSAARQYDLMFRISAWNRQIQTLKSAANRSEENGREANELLSEAQAQRARLVQEHKKGG